MLDDAPLARGSIRFEPTTAGGTSAGAVISNGKYQIDRSQGLPPGIYRVSISSPKAPAELNPSMDEGGLAEELIPARYNQQTTLQAKVSETGENVFTYELSTKEQPQQQE